MIIAIAVVLASSALSFYAGYKNGGKVVADLSGRVNTLESFIKAHVADVEKYLSLSAIDTDVKAGINDLVSKLKSVL